VLLTRAGNQAIDCTMYGSAYNACLQTAVRYHEGRWVNLCGGLVS